MIEATQYWSQDGLLVIGIAAPASRSEARTQLRQAVLLAAAQWQKLNIETISLQSSSGQPPRLLLAGQAAGLSFSHDEGLSLAAIHLHGPIGVDVMRVQDITDWRQLARDYLGPQVEQEMAACPAAQRALQLARAWTAREAALKCAGMQLAEWDGNTPACRLQTLPLPLPYVASLAY